MNQTLIILRGCPASGKSTLAKKLRNFEKKIIWLKIDNFKPFFAEDVSIALDYVNKTALAVLKYLVNESFSVVLEGIFQDIKYIDEAIKIADSKGISSYVFELKCSLQTLKKRDKQRDGVKQGCRKPLGDKLITNLFNTVTNNPFPKAEKLNTEKNSVDNCLATIKKNISSNLVYESKL